jgi:uncharacterized repeat protein (TIGR02543 family)
MNVLTEIHIAFGNINEKKENIISVLSLVIFTVMLFMICGCSQLLDNLSTKNENSSATTYTITYYANDASSGTVPVVQTKTQAVAVTLATNSGNLTKTGYAFAGWNTKSDGTGTDYAAGAVYTVNENVSLYAKWSIITTPEPYIETFKADQDFIAIGSGVTLSADFEYGTGIITPGNLSIESGKTRTVYPRKPTTYTLQVKNNKGSTTCKTVSVDIYLDQKYTYELVGANPINSYFQFSKTGKGWFFWTRKFSFAGQTTYDSWNGRFTYTIKGTAIDIYWKDGSREGTHSPISSYSQSEVVFENTTYIKSN